MKIHGFSNGNSSRYPDRVAIPGRHMKSHELNHISQPLPSLVDKREVQVIRELQSDAISDNGSEEMMWEDRQTNITKHVSV